MKRTITPWHFVAVLLLVSCTSVGYMAYTKRKQVAEISQMKQRVKETTTRVTALRAREQKLMADRDARLKLAEHLMDPESGTIYRQLLMALVDASRDAGTNLGRLAFAANHTVGEVTATTVSGAVNGTEPQLLTFIRLLEEGRPMGQIQKLSWTLVTDVASTGSGSVDFEVTLFGPASKKK